MGLHSHHLQEQSPILKESVPLPLNQNAPTPVSVLQSMVHALAFSTGEDHEDTSFFSLEDSGGLATK